MKETIVVKKNSYFDSVQLMRISNLIKKEKGITDAQLIMGTDQNKEFLYGSGIRSKAVDEAGPMDLVIYIKAEKNDTDPEELFAKALKKTRENTGEAFRHGSLEGAIKTYPGINFALISVPGKYAFWEARNALHLGLNVMIFSDNVSLDEEIELKHIAREKGLIVMGPDCGTAIVNGTPLAFANTVRSGNIGIVSASGTGLQAVACAVHNLGGGISQAIGTGGRDLSAEVGGISAKTAVEALCEDGETEVIAFISKPPDKKIMDEITGFISTQKKDFVVYFIGSEKKGRKGNIFYASSLDDAARIAVDIGVMKNLKDETAEHSFILKERKPGHLRAYYTGGTLAYECINILAKNGMEVRSNISKKPDLLLKDPWTPSGDSVIDLGEDFFTRGKAHPMIDPESRIKMLEKEALDPAGSFIILDIVLGWGSHEDMAGALTGPLKKLKNKELFAYILGTPMDMQNLEEQKKKLAAAGVKCFLRHDEMIFKCMELMGYEKVK